MKNPWKMKLTGYLCIFFAAAITAGVVFGWTDETRIQASLSLVGTWLLTGTGLLTVNAGKKIGGALVENKHNEAIK
jgi:hypothetical protein